MRFPDIDSLKPKEAPFSKRIDIKVIDMLIEL